MYNKCRAVVSGNCYSFKELLPEILIALSILTIILTLFWGV